MSISSYKLISRKGQGGMAEVFKAVKSGPDGFAKTVALKKILPTHSDQTHFIRMLSTEAKIHSYLSHPNIIQILDFFEENGQYSMVLEYVDGKNVKEILEICRARKQPLPWQACLFIMIEILKGLQYAHTKDGPSGPLHIVHRDVSPHNILISYEGDVKLSDFGIARAKIERDETASGILKGKYRYLSPEQVLSEKIEAPSDLFSAGVTLYEMLSLEHPFGEVQEYQTLQKIVDKPHVPLKKLMPNLKEGISHAVDQAMQKNPRDRFKNARGFYEDLLDLQDPNWITHGQELLSTLLGNIIPPELRADQPFEKTAVMNKPIQSPHSLLFDTKTVIFRRRMSWLAALILIPAIAGLLYFKFKPATSTPVIATAPIQEAKTEAVQKPIVEPETKSEPKPVQSKPITTAPKSTPAPVPAPRATVRSIGALSIEGPAKTQVYVNGKNMGQLPMADQSLPVGNYLVLLDRGEFGRQMYTARVIQKQTAKINWK